MSSLSHKQQRFVEEYLVDLNATQAAIRAGYSARTANRIASENLSKPVIQQAIQAAMQKRSEQMEITQQWVVEHLVEVVERCMETVPARDRAGRVLPGRYAFDAKGANTALSWIGKHLCMFTEKVAPVTPDGRNPFLRSVGELTSDELKCLIRAAGDTDA